MMGIGTTKHAISKVAMLIIFTYFLMVMRCWLGFGGRVQIMTYIFPFLMVGLIASNQMKVKFKRRYVIYSIIVFLFGYIGLKSGSNLNAVINQMFVPLNILFVISIVDDEKEYVLSKFIKWFGFIMMMGILLYFVSVLGSLPSLGTIMSDYGNKEISAGLYENFLFYIKPLERASNLTFLRFNGPFIEPGDLGCTAAFMLMAAKFDFKRYDNLIWVLLGLLVSMSLAGYILALIGYLMIIFADGRISKGRLIVFLLAILSFYLIGKYYNDGDNMLNEKILSRLETDEDKGFSGNNRNSLIKTEYFFAMFNDFRTMCFGYDLNTIKFLNETGLGSGFINKALSVGIVGMIGLILPYYYIAKTSSSKKYAWSFFIFFLLYMYQRSESTWLCYVVCYVYGIVLNEKVNASCK